MSEAELPLSAYGTIEDVFTRKLQAGSRKVADGYVSPADGMLVKSEAVHVGRAVQAKGITYSLSELVFGSKENKDAAVFQPAWFSTVYLAPHNYHRVHTPAAGKVTAMRYIPGRLWPVNGPAVRAIPGLFCRNERLVFDLALATGGKMWVVMVGALNVGRMVTPLVPSFVSNAAARTFGKVSVEETPLSEQLEKGAEIGTFMLGSTVVVAMDQEAVNALKPKALVRAKEVRMGESLSS